MPEQPFVPPPRKPVSEYPTPDHSVAFYTELVNRSDPAYIANSPVKRGSLYATMVGAKQEVIAQYPQLFFLKERKFQLNDQLVLWDWATDEQAHDTYNADVTYVANAIAYPAFTRVYTVRRELYEATPTLPIGSPLPGIVAVTITSPGQNYTKATGVIDGTNVAIQFNVSDNGGLIAGIITNTGDDLILNGTPITIIGDGQDGSAEAVTQPLGCVLTAQKKEELPDQDPVGHELVKTTLVYETLPGPWIYTTRNDKDGAIITSKTRRQIKDFIVDKDEILNRQWIQTFHKDVDDFVAEETVDSRPVPGNPIFDTKIDDDGKILTTVKTLVDRSTVVTEETLLFGTWTRRTEQEVDDSSLIKVHQASNLVCWQMELSRDIPGNPIPSTELDKDGNEIDVVRTMKAATDIVTDDSVVSGIWTRTNAEQITDLVSWEVVKARVVPGNPIPSANVTNEHEVAIIATTLKESTAITPVATEGGGIIHTVEEREVTDLVSEEVVTDVPFLDAAFYSVVIPNVIPELFRAFIPVRTESHILAGTASPPVLGPADFERSERQVTKLLFERRSTTLASITIPITFCGFKDTNQYKQIVTTCYTLEADSVVPPVPTALCDVEVIQLGQGMQVVVTRCVPNIFAAQLYEETKPDVTPEVFKATIPLDTASEIVAGSPSPPTLGTGEYRASEREVTEFTKETSLTSRDLTSLPKTITSFETDRDKSVVTVNTTLETDPTAPSTPNATTDVSYKPLGDGTAVEEVRSIPQVFGGQVYEKEIPDVVPVEFRVAIPTETQEVSQAGIAADPSLGAGDLQKREQQTDNFVKRVFHRFRSLVGIPISLISYATTRVKQLATITRTLKLAGAPTPPTATTDVETQNLGDGTVVETVTSVPDVFGEASFRRTRPDVTPPEFRALLQTDTQAITTAGNATDPTLGIGQLEKTSEQVTEFTKRDSTTARDLTAIPQTITDTDTDRDKQLETISKTLELSGTATAAPDAVTNVSVTQLGDGTEIQEVRTVPEVFSGQVFEKEIPDVVPVEFRVSIPTATTETSQAGTATDPTLGLGDLTKRETQTNEFVKRVFHRFRSIVALPVTLISYATNRVKQLVTVTRTLKVAGAPTPPTATTDVDTQNLGDGTVIETVNSVTSVFSEASFRRSRPDVTPPEFRALLQTDTQSSVTAGNATDPTLGVGELEKSSEQVTEFTKKDSTTARDLTSIPQTITDTATDRDKQVETINKTLELSGTATATPDATTTVSVTQLGDGTEVEQVTTVPQVFGGQVYEEERVDVVPPEFRVAIPTSTTEVSQAGTAADPVLGSGDLNRRETQTDTFVKRIYHRFRSLVGLPVTLISYDTSNVKQLVTVTKTLKTAAAPTPPTATTRVAQQNLGDGTIIETVDSVPDVFNRNEFSVRIPDVVPVEFRVAVPTTTTATDTAGTAAAPTLGTGDLSKSEQQVDEFVKRSTTEHRNAITYPISLAASKLTPEGQVETVNQVLDVGLQTATGSATTVESEVRNLGDGTSLLTQGTVPDVFNRGVYSKEIPDLVPIEFRPFVPTTTTAETSAGTASTNPVLGTGDLRKTEAQETEFKKRVTTESRGSIVLPVTHQNTEITEQFGGGVVDKSITLEVAGTGTTDEGLTVVSSSVTDLGNNTEIKRTDQLSDVAWPILASRLWDENMRVEYDETAQVVDAGTSEDPDPGGSVFAWNSEVRAIDKWRSRIINSSKPAPPYISSATAFISYEMKPFRFPGYLQFSGYGYYTRQAEAVLVLHKIRTWWLKSATTPTCGPVGGGFDVEFYPIITQDAIINNLSNTAFEYARQVLTDGFSIGVITFPPTTPTATEYSLGTVSGSALINLLSIAAPGTGYVLGDVLSFSGDGGSATVTVTAIGTASSILVITPLSGVFGWLAGTHGPYTASGGSGTGAAFYAFGINAPTYTPGSAWIGNPRVVAGYVKPEKEKDIWRCWTEEVVMQ